MALAIYLDIFDNCSVRSFLCSSLMGLAIPEHIMNDIGDDIGDAKLDDRGDVIGGAIGDDCAIGDVKD